MSSNKPLIVVLVLVFLGLGIYAWSNNSGNKTSANGNATSTVYIPEVELPSALEGCYVAGTDKDVYTLNISTQREDEVTGSLIFKNFEKDSSSGTFRGMYNNGILIGDYSFRSEGLDSVMQVAFKKEGNAFVRGYGEMNSEGTRFANPATLTYEKNSLSSFVKGACVSSTFSQIVFPKGDVSFTQGKKYTLKWVGGPETISIFLIDTSVKPGSTTGSIVDKIYNIKNTGSYEYTFSSKLKPGIYEVQIGNSTSDEFKLVKP